MRLLGIGNAAKLSGYEKKDLQENMAKRPKKRKSKGFPPATAKPEPSRSVAQTDKRPMRWDLLVLFLTIAIGGTYLAIWLRPKNIVPRFSYEVLKTYEHDPLAFTQGLVFDDGYLWESTGRYGESSLRKIDLESGEILKRVDLPKDIFAEGLAVHNNKLYQLTWQENKAFVYDREFNKIGEFDYEGEGWGLTSNGTDLIFSDGSTTIKFLDPETFKVRRQISVRRPDRLPVGELNELEYVNYQGGRIYANRYRYDQIYEIDPLTGDVTKVIDLSGLWPISERPADGLLNGIALNPKTDKLLVTGKLCPKIYELRLYPEGGDPKRSLSD